MINKTTTAGIISSLVAATVGTISTVIISKQAANSCQSLLSSLQKLPEQSFTIPTITAEVASLPIPLEFENVTFPPLEDITGQAAAEFIELIPQMIAEVCEGNSLMLGFMMTFTLSGLLALLTFMLHRTNQLQKEVRELKKQVTPSLDDDGEASLLLSRR